MADTGELRQNPFPGLRSFEANETHLFFGREGQSDEILKILGNHRFVAVVGTSGSGKSSLVRAGMIPSLEAGYMAQAGSSWRFAVMRPGEQQDPISSLAHRLADPVVFGASEIAPEELTRIIDTTLRRSSYGLIEAARLQRLQPGENLLVLVDQFEELFRLRSSRTRSLAEDVEAAFVRLLLEAARQTELPIYVVITMRSDFIGDCSEFRDLPEALNRAQFLIPRMTRDQRHEAIEGPIAVSGATVAPRLVQRMLNDVGDNPDQLPILQHALMRTWDAWYRAGKLDEPIDLAHYESIGGWENALSLHADEAFNELDGVGKEIAEKVFKALVERGPDNRETRRPGPVSVLSAIANASEDAVIGVIDHFRLPGRTFLMPSAEVRISSDSIIDISHESLIRLWRRLREWVTEEVESATIYKRLADAAQRHKQGRAGLWRDPDLRIALEWKEKNRPNTAWADRYAPGFGDAVEFLDASHRDQERDRAEREHAQRLLQFRLKALRAIAAVLIVAFGFSAYLGHKERLAKEAAKHNLQAALLAEQGAEAREVRTHAYQTKDATPEVSALLAIEAARIIVKLDKYDVSTDYILREALRIVKPYASYPTPGPGNRERACSGKPIAMSLSRGRIRRNLFTPVGDRMDFSPTGAGFVTICQSDVAGRAADDPLGGIYDWHSPAHAIALQNSAQDTAVAFVPDGLHVVAGGDDRIVQLLDAKSGAQVWHHPLPGPIAALSVAPSGRYVVAGFGDAPTLDSNAETIEQQSTGGLALLSVEDGAAQPAPDVNGWVVDADFSPDGKTIAAANWNGEGILFDPESGKELMPRVHPRSVLRRQPFNATSVTFSSNGAYVAYGFASMDPHRTVGRVAVFDTATLKQVGADILLWGEVDAIRFTPVHGTPPPGEVPALAVLSRQYVWVEEWDSGAGGWQLRGDVQNPVASTMFSDAVFSPDGTYLVTADTGGYVRFYDPSSMELVTYRRFANLGQVSGLKFDRDGDFIAAIGTERTEVFNVRRDLLASRATILPGASSSGEGLAAFSKDLSTAVVPAEDGSEMVYTLDDKGQFQSRRLIEAKAQPPAPSAAASPVVSATATQVPTAASSNDDKQSTSESVRSIAISADNKLIAISGGDEIEVQDAASGSSKWRAQAIGEALAFSADSHWLASAEDDQKLHLRDASKGTPGWVSKAIGHAKNRALAFSPSGAWIAAGTDKGVFVADSASGDFSAISQVTGASVLAFDAEDKALAIASEDGTVILMNVGDKPADFSIASTFKAVPRDSSIDAIQFSNGGRYLMVHDSTNTVLHLFDLAHDNVEISNFNGFNQVFAASFNDATGADVKVLLAISNPNSISVMRTNTKAYVDPEKAIGVVCEALTRNLTCREWQSYFPDTRYRKTCDSLPLPEGAPDCKIGGHDAAL